MRSNIFLCDETCSCSPLSFEKGLTVLCCKVLQSVNWQLLGGGQVFVVMSFCYQIIGGVVEDELVLICISWRKFDSKGMIGFEVNLNSVTTE